MAKQHPDPKDSKGTRERPDGTRPASTRSRRGLDWFVFFVADVQTGFGPFVAVFLTTEKWTQVDIGLVLTISGLVSLFGQVPIGALVDWVRSIRAVAVVSLVIIGASAFAFAIWPIYPVVIGTRVLHALASCALGLTIVSLSVGLARSGEVGQRLGRNAAFASAGTGIAAAVMGACGYLLSSQMVFFLAGSLVIPAIFALTRIRADEIKSPTAEAATEEGGTAETSATRGNVLAGLLSLARNRALVIFAICVVMFHLANAAMLPLAASMLTLRSSEAATVMVAAAMVVPQFTVTLLSPWVGRTTERWGRRPFLILGFAALAIRGVLFAMTTQPYLLVGIQILDGVSAAVLGVLVPLTIADLTRGTGRLNLAQGTIGAAMGIGASISTTLSGFVADWLDSYTAFATLATLAGVGLLIVAFAMPETRAKQD